MEIFLIRLLQFLMAISLLVFLHELGHFTFARIFGVRVTRFYLFFNPKFHLVSTYDTWLRRLLKKKPEVVPTRTVTVTEEGKKPKSSVEKKFVGTEWGIGWLPLGGYCAIDGMVDETNFQQAEESDKVHIDYGEWQNDISAEEEEQFKKKGGLFSEKPTWQRLLIMLGGVMVNFVLALFIYSMILFYWGETYVPIEKMQYGMKFNSEAKALGFHDGDILVSTDRGKLKRFDEPFSMTDVYRELSKARQVNVVRQGKPTTINIPETAELNLMNMVKSQPIFVRPFVPIKVDSIIPGTPAAEAGLQRGDSIVAINGKAISSYNEFTDEIVKLSDALAQKATAADSIKLRTVSLAYLRGNEQLCDTIVLTDSLKLGFYNICQPFVNIMYQDKAQHFDYGFFESFPAGISYGWKKLTGYVSDLQYVFTAEGAKSLGGFGAIGSMFPAQWDWHRFWEMTAFLSIILAFMNIIPIPGLDGGHVLFLLYELVTRRKPSEKFMVRAEYAGFAILVILMVVANLNDVLRWIGVM